MALTISHSRCISSPLGELTLCAHRDQLCAVLWPEQALPHQKKAFEVSHQGHAHEVLDAAAEQLESYFAGSRQRFSLALGIVGTAFQQRVWSALQETEYGETLTYGELARRLGRPQAARAVGRAVGSNLLAMVIPCHRIVGKNGELTGFAGGLQRKRWLLALEAETR